MIRAILICLTLGWFAILGYGQFSGAKGNPFGKDKNPFFQETPFGTLGKTSYPVTLTTNFVIQDNGSTLIQDDGTRIITE